MSVGGSARQEISYDTLSSGTRARYGTSNAPEGLRDTHVPSAATYPTASMQKGSAVRRFLDRAHATPGRSSNTLHLYEGARTGMTGRGSLGFNRHHTKDQTTGDVTEYNFSLSSFPLESLYYLYPRAMRPSSVQMRATFTATTEFPQPDTDTLTAPAGVVAAPYMEVAEIYLGRPLRLDHVYQYEQQRTRTDGEPITTPAPTPSGSRPTTPGAT